jgi:hypothetical protein
MPEESLLGKKVNLLDEGDINTDGFSETHIFAILCSRFAANVHWDLAGWGGDLWAMEVK